MAKWGTRVDWVCPCCKKVESVRPSEARSKKSCSRECARRIASTAPKAVCPTCHNEFSSKMCGGERMKFCCRECVDRKVRDVHAECLVLRSWSARTEAVAKAEQMRVQAEIDGIRRLGRSTFKPRVFIQECRECGCSMIVRRASGSGGHRVLCASCLEQSQRKQRRIAKAKRRARIREAEAQSIDPIRVFERDKWKCHICGRKTPRAKRGTIEDDAPELDHLISLAEGGTHTWGNVACSCRKCNGEKGANSFGQLGLPIAA